MIGSRSDGGVVQQGVEGGGLKSESSQSFSQGKEGVSSLDVKEKRIRMSDLDILLSQLQAEAVAIGSGWLQTTIANLLRRPSQASADSPPGLSHGRPRPPECFSPEVTSRVWSHSGSPSKDPSTPLAKRKPALHSVGETGEILIHSGPGGIYICSLPPPPLLVSGTMRSA